MKKYFILMCFGSFILGIDNHIDNKFVEIIMCVIGLLLVMYGTQKLTAKPLLKRINKLNLYHYIDKNFIQAIEEGFEDTSFILSENELNDHKDYIDLYRRKHGSIVYKIEYEVDEDSAFIYKCRFVKAYDMNEKEYIDEENKTIHLFRNRNYLRYTQRAFLEHKEIEVEFNNKKYSCIVTSFSLVDEYDEDENMMIEIEFEIIKEIN